MPTRKHGKSLKAKGLGFNSRMTVNQNHSLELPKGFNEPKIVNGAHKSDRLSSLEYDLDPEMDKAMPE